MSDVSNTHTKILERMDDRLVQIQVNLTDTRERVIAMEAKDTPKRVAKMEERVERHGDRLARIETKGAMLIAAVSVFASVGVAYIKSIFSGNA